MNEIISENYTKAVALHRRICANAQSAQESLFEVCRGLKEMRDGKLYKELGYQNFEDYCETEVGIKRRQVYNYISIVEKLPEDFVQPVAQIGMSKLYLLSTLSEGEREEVMQTTDVEKVSKRELEAKIAEVRSLKAQVDSLTADRDRVQEKVKSLESQIEEIEKRPVEVAVQESHEVENMRLAMERLNEDIAKQDAQMRQEYEDRIRSLKERHEAELKAAQVQVKTQEKPDITTKFRAYLTNAVDASERLTEFLKQHPDEQFRVKTAELFRRILQEV